MSEQMMTISAAMLSAISNEVKILPVQDGRRVVMDSANFRTIMVVDMICLLNDRHVQTLLELESGLSCRFRVHKPDGWSIDLTRAKWRVGRHVGRTIYRQVGDEPSREDVLIGVMDTPEMARAVVTAINSL